MNRATAQAVPTSDTDADPLGVLLQLTGAIDAADPDHVPELATRSSPPTTTRPAKAAALTSTWPGKPNGRG